ncbi:hypothetical protein [Halapricum desulfuricans]|nr:hypothetical protein [Halapricum desulfuricans]
MDHLVSCYFCGDAVDAQLEEYPLAASGRVETGTSVVLCPSCRRKLTTVVEEVLDAAIESADSQPVELDGDPLETLEEPTTGGMAVTDVESVDPRDDESSDVTGDQADEDDGEGDVEVSENDDDDDVRVDESADSGTRIDENDSDDAGETTAPEERETADSEDVGETPADTTSQTATADDDFRRSEYNKVVRLLQNREFPVEIEEITVVARSAYGIDRDTTHAILNALIENEILEDRGDELVRA